MKFAFLALVLVASHACGDELRLGFYDPPADEALFKITAQADRKLYYDYYDKNNDKGWEFGLGLEKITNGKSSSIMFTFDEIKNFLRTEKHKGLIVVRCDKSFTMDKDEVIRKRTDQMVKQMREVGYKRVVVLGSHALGTYYLADTDLKAGWPKQGIHADATKPEN